MATAESWIKGHEKLCGDRYRLLLAVISTGAAILVGVSGWSLNQVHDDQRQQVQLLQNLSAQVTQARAQPPPN